MQATPTIRTRDPTRADAAHRAQWRDRYLVTDEFTKEGLAIGVDGRLAG